MIKTFLINLDKNPERLAESTRQLNAMGVPFERVKAVYGKDLSAAEKRTAVNRFRWWCAQGRKIRDGEIGCALSHYGLYRRMIAEHVDCFCVLEDDNEYLPRFREVLEQVGALIDVTRPQVVLLSNCSDQRAASEIVMMLPAASDQWTSAYVITLMAAKNLLAANFPMHVPCDYWRRWVDVGKIELYHAFPTVTRQATEVFGSDIEFAGMERVSEFSRLHWLFHKCKRLIGVAIDRFLLTMGVWR